MQDTTTASYQIIVSLIEKNSPTLDDLLALRKEISQRCGLAHMPSNAQIIKSYYQLIQDKKISRRKDIEQLLRKRAVRSQSWIVPVQVLTKPFWCPWECIFCPNDATMPKSYINTEPGAQRALLNNFDPRKQVFNRLLSLTLTGHEVDKVEMIVLWGTWDVYPHEYKVEFIKWLYDACNHFQSFFEQYIAHANTWPEWVGQDYEMRSHDAELITKNFVYPWSIEESIMVNQTASCRIIGLTVETRPEYVTHENCVFRRSLGVTRIEMGIQSMFDDVLAINKRGHTIEQCREAMNILREHSFKVSVHLMPWLYGSTIQKDIDTFRLTFADLSFRPDEIKFYPTAVIPNTELYQLYCTWAYTPLTLEENKYIIKTVLKEHIPPYTRIKRLIRDIPSEETVWSHYVTNLRQLVEQELTDELNSMNDQAKISTYSRLYDNLTYVARRSELIDQIISLYHQWPTDSIKTFMPCDIQLDLVSPRSFVCLDTRSREIRNTPKDKEVFPIVRTYRTTNGLQCFVSYEDTLGYLYWFARLQLPLSTDESSSCAQIRELHVYGQLATLWSQDEDTTQHQWLWGKLMELAEEIALCGWYTRLSVISGVWVRKYYEKLGYSLVGTEMEKAL